MRFLRRASSFLNNMRSDDSGSGVVSKTISFISGFSLVPIISVGLSLFVILIIALALITTFSYKINLFQFVDLGNFSSSSNVGVDLNYNFDEYVSLTDSAIISSGNPSADLSTTDIKSVSSFNQHIKDSVCKAGFGTRAGVVAAGMSMLGDYIKYTGKRVKYHLGNRNGIDAQTSDTIGIGNENHLAMDCSGFTFWALYNGGFNLPSDLPAVQTSDIKPWSDKNGFTKDVKSAQPGDLMITSGHIIMIVGKYSDGYYVAEEAGYDAAGIIRKRDFDNLESNGYSTIDLTNYFNNKSNIRNNDYNC